MVQPSPGFVEVLAVAIVSGYVLQLSFSKGQTHTLDVESMPWVPAFEPMRTSYEVFLQVRADPEAGTIVWRNGAERDVQALHQKSAPTGPA